MDFLKEDSSGGWQQDRVETVCRKLKGTDCVLFTQYYVNTSRNKFRKCLSFVGADERSRVPATSLCDVLLVRYYWAKGAAVSPFDVGAAKKPKIAQSLHHRIKEKLDPGKCSCGSAAARIRGYGD